MRTWTLRQVRNLLFAVSAMGSHTSTGAGPGPRTLLKGQRNIKFPIPRSRSPLKTNLKSPARKNPHLDRLSSPTRGSPAEGRDATVTRRLNFSGRTSGSASVGRPKTNGTSRLSRFEEEEEEEEEEEDEEDEDEELAAAAGGDDEPFADDELDEPMHMIDAIGEDENYEDEDEPLVRRPASEKRGRGKPKTTSRTVVREPSEDLSADDDPAQEEELDQDDEDAEAEQDEQPVARSVGRPPKSSQAKKPAPKKAALASPQSKKRRSPRVRTSGSSDAGGYQEVEAEDPEQYLRQAKRQKTQASASVTASPAKPKRGKPPAARQDNEGKPEGKKSRGRPPKKAKEAESGEAGETSFMALQRGPPMPKSRALVSVRRDADSMALTRSGRHSYRPVEYWRGEEVVVGEEEQDGRLYNDQGFVMPTIKEVIRVPESTLPSKRAPRSQTRNKIKAKDKLEVVEEDEELEEWEISPGTMAGEVVLWEPEHELHPPAEDEPVNIIEEQVALSADAVQTRDIRDATFRFAKTLTMPFMGAGVVDLPPGAEKRPKNSRKMHMVFFVHYGKVMVTINETQFRISAGGTWFVPRGEFLKLESWGERRKRVAKGGFFGADVRFLQGITTASATTMKTRLASSSLRDARYLLRQPI